VRRFLIILGILAIIVAALLATSPVLRSPLLLISLYREAAPAHLPVPVDGVKPRQLTNQWGSPRSEGRRHQGIDIFARRGTPIRSATRGIVLTVGTNRLGGKIVRVLGPGATYHYYAHLDRHAPLRVGQPIHTGTLLGYVGTTGNARGTPPHLHYGLYSRIGRPLNPYPLLAR
jgi:murein DD-endopeptidase MepM/ murein hydrolase activator NlpD